MTRGIATWAELGAIEGNVLVIVNVPIDQPRVAAAVFDEIARLVPAGTLHVIAAPAWSRWLAERAVAAERVLLTAEPGGGDLELNFFLQSPFALQWIASRRFSTILGCAAHSLYNEEIKDIFERRVCLLLGDGRFIAHALPAPYLFVLDLADLLIRAGRTRKLEAYRTTCRGVIDDLQRLWIEEGRPAVSDGRPSSDMEALLARHLGPAALAFDEASPIPLPHADTSRTVAEVVADLETTLHRAIRFDDERHAEMGRTVAELRRVVAQQQEEINLRDRHLVDAHDERTHAVSVRDGIIDDLRREQARISRGWRGWIVKRR